MQGFDMVSRPYTSDTEAMAFLGPSKNDRRSCPQEVRPEPIPELTSGNVIGGAVLAGPT